MHLLLRPGMPHAPLTISADCSLARLSRAITTATDGAALEGQWKARRYGKDRIASTVLQPMTSDNMRQRVFRRMLAREAGTGAGAPAIAAAARRLCQHLAQQLTPLIGDAGVAAICARSLHLTQQKFPRLAPVGASDQGDGPFALLQRSLEQQEPAAAAEAAVAVFATAGELLDLFIGESLTTRVLCEAWPDDFAGDASPRRPPHD